MSYKTPEKFSQAFQVNNLHSNLRNVQILSFLFLCLSVFIRLIWSFYSVQPTSLENFETFSILNWTQMGGTASLFLLSTILIKSNHQGKTLKKVVIFVFIIFILLTSFSISYTISLNNTKNTLLVFLLGISTVSLFFVLELIEITIITIAITLVYWLSMIPSKIPMDEKMMNFYAGMILGFILHIFSRYNYFYKSQHFVRIKELEEKNQEIAKLHVLQGEILASVAHDLRSPLNNIEAISSMLYEDSGKEELKMVLNASSQAKNIINDLIEGIKAEHHQLEKQSLNLSLFLEETVEKWKSNSHRELVLEMDGTPIQTEINASKLERVMDNLISNAIKFSPTDKKIVITLKEMANKIEIKVKDYGIGIPKEMKELVFHQFSKAGRPGLKGEESIGLGLHISKRIIQQHGGDLTVDSEINQGTTFTVFIPQLIA